MKAGKNYKISLIVNVIIVSCYIEELFRSENRYRDIAFSPDGSTIYVITDPRGPVQAMKEGPITPTLTLWSPGALIAFKYVGTAEGVGENSSGGNNVTSQ